MLSISTLLALFTIVSGGLSHRQQPLLSNLPSSSPEAYIDLSNDPSAPISYSRPIARPSQYTKENAPQIFNSVHSALRQWGSSLNHNGMSYFLAHVPAGTEFYHGRGGKAPVKGMEWLAFEPEHAINFAWCIKYANNSEADRTGNVRREGHNTNAADDGNETDDCDEMVPNGIDRHSMTSRWLDDMVTSSLRSASSPKRHNQRDASSFAHEDGDRDDDEPKLPDGIVSLTPGHLHTLRARRPLTLLYLDGMAAGKSARGTVDSQDNVLLLKSGYDFNQTNFPDLWRAGWMCDGLAKQRWEGRVHGFVRMEHGFEVILCDFERDLELLDAIAMNNDPENHGHEFPITGQYGFSFVKAITSRYDGLGSEGIGRGRVAVDFSTMVTGWNYASGSELIDDGFYNSDAPQARLAKLNETARYAMFDELEHMILGRGPRSSILSSNTRQVPTEWSSHLPPIRDMDSDSTLEQHSAESIDWQAVADMIVARYSDLLHGLAYLNSLGSKELLDREIRLLLRPFINYTNRNVTWELQKCTHHFLPPIPKSEFDFRSSVPSLAVLETSHIICSSLFAGLKITSPSGNETEAFDLTRSHFRELVQRLDWTSHKKCTPGCLPSEVCITAIWPFGVLEDHLHPNCQNLSVLSDTLQFKRGHPLPPDYGSGKDSASNDTMTFYWDIWHNRTKSPPELARMSS